MKRSEEEYRKMEEEAAKHPPLSPETKKRVLQGLKKSLPYLTPVTY